MNSAARFIQANQLWLVLGTLVFVLLAWWLNLRWQAAKGGWKYKKETIPELGRAKAVYQRGELQWLNLKKHGVNLEIGCEDAEEKAAGIKFTQSLTKEKLDEYLRLAVEAIPESEKRPWGFDRGKWELEHIRINGENSLVLEIGNSADRDHCCRLLFENGKYEFECVDG